MPALADVAAAPLGQALPYIFGVVMGSPGGGLALTFLVLVITMFCSISITTAASRTTWAFARDDAIPGAKLFSKVNTTLGVPVNALVLTTIVQMLLALINLGSSSAFLAFVSVGVIALQVSYGIPIFLSLVSDRRHQVNQAKWNVGSIAGTTANVIALCWISFEVVLFSMPTTLPTSIVLMNYASVVLVGFGVISATWYFAYARKGVFSPQIFRLRKLTFNSIQRSSCFGWTLIAQTYNTIPVLLFQGCRLNY